MEIRALTGSPGAIVPVQEIETIPPKGVWRSDSAAGCRACREDGEPFFSETCVAACPAAYIPSDWGIGRMEIVRIAVITDPGGAANTTSVIPFPHLEAACAHYKLRHGVGRRRDSS